MLSKKKLIFLALIISLVLTPLVYARSYGEGIYGSGNYTGTTTLSLYCGDGICNNGETCSSCSGDCGACPVTPSPGGGGGGAACYYDWQCTNWFPSICPESGTQERICMNKGSCKGTEGIPNQTQKCEYLGPKEPLFDIYLSLEDKYKKICSENKIKANIKLENYAKVELLDAFMTYWIIDENNKLIAELKDTRAVEKSTNFDIEMKIPDSTPEGTYRLYAEITYSGNKTAVAGETFEVLSEEECASFHIGDFNWMYLVYGVTGIFLVLLILILVKFLRRFKITRRKTEKTQTHEEYRNKIKQNLKKIRGKHFLMILAGFMLIGFLFINGNKITGFAIGSASAVTYYWSAFGIILIIGVLGLLIFVYRTKIVEKIEIIKRNKYPENSLKGLIKKKVYTDSGFYVGQIKDIILGENKIDSLKIKIDKKYRFEKKGIVINYKQVKNVSEIVIIDKEILEKLKS
ncbi:hypothetical protein FJZ19_04850 [Candidatus Pacearchaeota archaeon]|nr:hypothetical protein [Candidatus Pacearchaeota archaeon]